MLFDVTACPQDIAYPTDIKILNTSREKSEELFDALYDRTIHRPNKSTTYLDEARINYLLISKKKVRRRKELGKAISQQLRYLRRNLSTIKKLLSKYPLNPLNPLKNVNKRIARQLKKCSNNKIKCMVTGRIVHPIEL